MVARTGLMRYFLGLCCLMVLPSFLHCGPVKDCYYDTDCSLGKVCKEGKCETITRPSCTKDGDCEQDQKCITKRCVLLPPGFKFPKAKEIVKEITPEEVTVVENGEGSTPGDGGEVTTPDKREGTQPEKGEPIVEQKPLIKCKREDDCQKDEVCALGGPGDKELGCLPRNKQGRAFGDGCNPSTKPSECISQLCHPTNKVCTISCMDDNDCPSGKDACKETTFPNGAKAKICVATDKTRACLRDTHCGEGLICRVMPDAQSKAVLGCGNARGGTAVGKTCFGNSGCRNDVCVGREICSAPCVNDGDCPKLFECASVEIAYPDAQSDKYTFRLCRLPVNGLKCKLDKECIRTLYKCSPADINNQLELRCQKSSGNGIFGDKCAKDADCRSNFCLVSGVCSQSCTADKDCPALGGLNVICADISLTRGGASGKIKGCLAEKKPCSKDADCQQSEACAPYLNDAGNYSLRCIVRFSTSGKADGTSCQAHSDCRSLFCKNKTCSTCQNDTDCGTGRACFQGHCTSAKKLGGDCKKHEDCVSLTCVSGKCSRSCTVLKDCQNSGFACEEATLTSGKSMFKKKFCVAPQGGLPCASNKDCPSAQEGECRIVEVNNKIVLRCRAKVGSKKTNESCTKDSDCISGTCLVPESVCSAVCQKDTDCSVGGLLCLEREFKPTAGAGAKIKVCSLELCDGDADCKETQICAYQAVGSKGFLRCMTPNAAKKKRGAACTTGSECQSNLCRKQSIGNVCSAPCYRGVNAVCPLQLTCESIATGTNSTHLCIPVSNTCEKDSDCSSGKVCTLSIDVDKRPFRKCTAPIGKSKNGDVCEPMSKTSQCESGFCDPLTLRCSLFCTSDSDCKGSDYKCSSTTFKKAQGQIGPDWTFKYCRSTVCIHDGDCQSGEACNVRVIQGKTTKRCVKATAGKPGSVCSTSSDCSSGLCRSRVCASACSAHRHCSLSQICTSIQILPGISSFGCVGGRRSSCSGDPDCPKGQVCQAYTTPQGQAVTECKTPQPTHKTIGQSCSPGTFPSQCSSGLCDTVTQVCLKVCEPSLFDCKIGTEVCGKFPLFKKFVNACIPTPKPCKKQSDCPSATVCIASIEQGKVVHTCSRPNGIQTKKVGDACDKKTAFPGQCQTQLCHPALNICVNTCETDADCPSARPKCGKIELPGGLLAKTCTTSNAACDHDATCPNSEPVCALELVSNSLKKRCSRGGPGTKKIGESCDANKNLPGDCENHFCEAGTLSCLATCSKDSHCPSGLVCNKTFVEGTRVINGCVKAPGALCVRLTDCAKPEVCSVERRTAGIVATCKNFTNLDHGKACTPADSPAGSKNYKFNTACSSRVCHPKSSRCTSVCRNDADCISIGGKCKPMKLDGYQVNVCDSSCAISKDCPSGQVCGAGLIAFGALSPICVVIDSRLKPVGGACDPSKALFAECQTGFCSPVTSKCTAFCVQDTDCASGEICETSFVRLSASAAPTETKACVPSAGSCTHQSHCFHQRICGAKDHNGQITTSCLAVRQGAHGAGTGCDDTKPFPGDCGTNLCDPKSKNCTIVCRSDSDCSSSGNRTKCGTIMVKGSPIRACIKP